MRLSQREDERGTIDGTLCRDKLCKMGLDKLFHNLDFFITRDFQVVHTRAQILVGGGPLHLEKILLCVEIFAGDFNRD